MPSRRFAMLNGVVRLLIVGVIALMTSCLLGGSQMTEMVRSGMYRLDAGRSEFGTQRLAPDVVQPQA